MITRIQLLRNIGQFESVDTGANIPLARLTLIYSENGRGKTTLAAVLRSLATGDPMPIAERKRLAAQHPPHVVLECDGAPPPAIFQSNAWNRILNDLVIFDDVFIDQNVYSGLAVQAHHRQNLHDLILGAPAVAMSRRLQELVERVETHNRELRTKARAIPIANRGPLSVDEFCALPEIPDVDQAIDEAQRALSGAQEQDSIRATPRFEPLSLPEFDVAEIERVLQQDLPALEAGTVARVEAHLAKIGYGGQAWVSDGMRRIAQTGAANEECPFCAQDLQGSPMITHYRAFFSTAYSALKRTVTDTLDRVSRTHGGEVPAGFERAVRVTVERRHFWTRFCQIAEFTVDTAAIGRDWRAAREAIVALLAAKQAAPLERIPISDVTHALLAAYEASRAEVAAISQRLQEGNQAVDIAKERAVMANAQILANDLAGLKAVKARHEPETAALCEEYLQERAGKERTEQARDEMRQRLEQHRQRVFPQYQTAINQYLARFNAGFRLDSVTYATTRGGPTCTYNVLINETPVPVRSDRAPGAPSFRNTLSAGDRNTLALAFFFASLARDPTLASKIVVIDDPISSLDEHRALTTVQQIRRLSERVAQVIVLSHNKPFLARLWEGTDPTMRAAVEVVRDGAGSTLGAWNVAEDSVTEHDRRDARLREFLNAGGGNARELARSIRPHLEAFLRVMYPEFFPPGALLGHFRNRCRQKLGTAEQILDQRTLDELDDIAEYANKLHHDTNPAWETEAINDAELRGYVQGALTFGR